MTELFKLVDGISVPLSDQEIQEFEAFEAEHTFVKEALARTEYQRLRAEAYPPINDLVVALMEDREGRPEMLAEIRSLRAEVKARFPKPE